jgi:hypothetical protein
MDRNACIAAMLDCNRDAGCILKVVRAYLADKDYNESWLIHKMYYHAVNGFML